MKDVVKVPRIMNLMGGVHSFGMLAGLSIIGFPAALLFRVIEKATDQTKPAKCIGNLNQICVALRSFSNDHDGRISIAWEDPNPPSPARRGTGALRYTEMPDYLGTDGRIYVCPKATYRNPKPTAGNAFGATSYELSKFVSGAMQVGIFSLFEKCLVSEGIQIAAWRSVDRLWNTARQSIALQCTT